MLLLVWLGTATLVAASVYRSATRTALWFAGYVAALAVSALAYALDPYLGAVAVPVLAAGYPLVTLSYAIGSRGPKA